MRTQPAFRIRDEDDGDIQTDAEYTAAWDRFHASLNAAPLDHPEEPHDS